MIMPWIDSFCVDSWWTDETMNRRNDICLRNQSKEQKNKEHMAHNLNSEWLIGPKREWMIDENFAARIFGDFAGLIVVFDSSSGSFVHFFPFKSFNKLSIFEIINAPWFIFEWPSVVTKTGKNFWWQWFAFKFLMTMNNLPFLLLI